jgi:ketosteroid isomerase-like protein
MPIPPPAAARAFAEGWVDAWNAHDLNAVLAHYSDDFEFSSPLVIQIAGEPTGTLKGKAAVQAYWRAALACVPTLRFDLVDVLAGVDCLTILYRGHRGLAAELFELDANGRAVRGRALYTQTG